MNENGVYLRLICNAWGEGAGILRSISEKEGSKMVLNPH